MINVLIGLVRIKALALILGPLGVGLAGLLDSILRSASTLAGLGLNISGVRQLAVSGDDPAALARVRRALFVANLVLGIVGGAILWALRAPIAQYVFGENSSAGSVGWLGLGVVLTLAAASQTTLLQGMRRVGNLARVSVLGASAGAVGGMLAIWFWGQAGIVAFILLAPASAAIAGAYYVARLPRVREIRTPVTELAVEWREMAVLGFAFMLTTLLTEWTQLFVRSLIGRTLSLESTGHFQAAWTISMQYIGFVLGAMATDYYPRLAGSIEDQNTSNRLVNEQIQAGLLLAGPVILGMLALAPWVIELLYSAGFSESVDILRWQVLGDVLKIASWPMGFILLARAERAWFLLTQSFWNGAYAFLVWLGLPVFGLEITGIAFFGCYFAGFAINCLVTRHVARFRPTGDNLRLLGALLVAASFVVAASHIHAGLALIVGLAAATTFGGYAISRLMQLSSLEASMPKAMSRLTSALRRWR